MPKPKPEKPSLKGVAYRGPPALVDAIDKAAGELGLSRNEAMTQLLRFALDAHEKRSKR